MGRPERINRAVAAALSRQMLLGNGDQIFGITRHAEFGHVQPFLFDLGRHAHDLILLTTEKTQRRCPEGPERAKGRPAKLHQELARVAVEQAGDALAGVAEIVGRADAVPSGAVSAVGKNADANRAQPAAIAVDGNRAAGIVDLEHAIVEEHAEADQKPASTPMMTAEVGETNAQGAVIATSPASMPLQAMVMSGLPKSEYQSSMAAAEPATAARLVLTATTAMRRSVAPSVEPGLKPIQPNSRMNVPVTT